MFENGSSNIEEIVNDKHEDGQSEVKVVAYRGSADDEKETPPNSSDSTNLLTASKGHGESEIQTQKASVKKSDAKIEENEPLSRDGLTVGLDEESDGEIGKLDLLFWTCYENWNCEAALEYAVFKFQCKPQQWNSPLDLLNIVFHCDCSPNGKLGDNPNTVSCMIMNSKVSRDAAKFVFALTSDVCCDMVFIATGCAKWGGRSKRLTIKLKVPQLN